MIQQILCMDEVVCMVSFGLVWCCGSPYSYLVSSRVGRIRRSSFLFLFLLLFILYSFRGKKFIVGMFLFLVGFVGGGRTVGGMGILFDGTRKPAFRRILFGFCTKEKIMPNRAGMFIIGFNVSRIRTSTIVVAVAVLLLHGWCGYRSGRRKGTFDFL